MEKLKIGDKLYRKENQRWGKELRSYNISEVVRLTPTTAVLNTGVKLINIPVKLYHSENFGFEVYGDRWSKYEMLTNEIVKEHSEWFKLVKAKQFVDANERKWTDEQYLQINDLFNNNQKK